MLYLSLLTLLTGQTAPSKPLFYTEFQFWEQGALTPSGKRDKAFLGHTSMAAERDLIAPSIRGKVGTGEVVVTLNVAPDGLVSRCQSVDGDQSVGKEICTILAVPGRVPVAYDAPGHPISKDWRISFNWDTPVAAAGPAKVGRKDLFPTLPQRNGAGQWPAFDEEDRIVLKEMPPPIALIQAFRKATALKARGFVGAYAQIHPQNKQVECLIGAGSGNPNIDRIACDLVSSIGFTFPKPLTRTTGVYIKPVRVEFGKQGIKLRLPSRPPVLRATMVGQPTFTAAELKKIATLRSTPHTYLVQLRVLPSGATSECRIQSGWLANAVDAMICPVVQRQKFLPIRDVFGDPTSSVTSVDVRVGT